MRKAFLLNFTDGRPSVELHTSKQVERYLNKFASDADRVRVFELKQELTRSKWTTNSAPRAVSDAPNSYVRYTGAMNRKIASLVQAGLNCKQVAKEMDRTPHAITQQVYKMGLKFS